ncbi:BAI_1a_G0043290.mRNA.1.CDS.1 [Saccharomyces cerevisiae]|nr:BAI_1a_G0043290.mRNA.1.CDS.1 [Saccharomyces cerevisiae]CAI7287767.1 BAI_1a_G0043290.mRNA.1.CDS.1 [Saccharomyces cerevisiae]
MRYTTFTPYTNYFNLYTLMSILQKNHHQNHLNIKIFYSSTMIHKHTQLRINTTMASLT